MPLDHPLRLSPNDTVVSLLDQFADEVKSLGVVAGLYTLVPPFHSQVGKRAVVSHFGFPSEIAAAYLDPKIQSNDPFPDMVVQCGRTMTWREAIAEFAPPADQLERYEQLKAAGHPDGIALPLYGPNGRASYAALSLGRNIVADDANLVREFINIGQFYHRKICVAIMRDHARRVSFSKRQTEVIYWIARGKSTPDIATIMGVSPATIDTFIRRIYAKLDVNDRVTAVIEAMARGLLRF